VVEHGHAEEHGPTGVLKWLTTTDHKVIGLSYMITSLVMFYLAGIMALVIRLQLASPSSSLLSFSQYNELFTMHGSLMLYLFAGPFAFVASPTTSCRCRWARPTWPSPA